MCFQHDGHQPHRYLQCACLDEHRRPRFRNDLRASDSRSTMEGCTSCGWSCRSISASQPNGLSFFIHLRQRGTIISILMSSDVETTEDSVSALTAETADISASEGKPDKEIILRIQHISANEVQVVTEDCGNVLYTTTSTKSSLCSPTLTATSRFDGPEDVPFAVFYRQTVQITEYSDTPPSVYKRGTFLYNARTGFLEPWELPCVSWSIS